jgi:serine/threonine protein kinase
MGNTSLSQYQIGNTIGSGAYGTVYKAERKSDSKTFAIKTVNMNSSVGQTGEAYSYVT